MRARAGGRRTLALAIVLPGPYTEEGGVVGALRAHTAAALHRARRADEDVHCEQAGSKQGQDVLHLLEVRSTVGYMRGLCVMISYGYLDPSGLGMTRARASGCGKRSITATAATTSSGRAMSRRLLYGSGSGSGHAQYRRAPEAPSPAISLPRVPLSPCFRCYLIPYIRSGFICTILCHVLYHSQLSGVER